MALHSLQTVKQLLAEHGLKPRKQLGQNFLLSAGVLHSVVLALALSTKDAVVEIGPGLGTLTRALAKTAKQVIAVEKDERLSEIAKEATKEFPNVEIVSKDILQWQLPENLRHAPYKAVGNLPYYITSPVIRKFLEEVPRQPDILVFMTQKEVARRICANPPDMTILSVSVQFYASPKLVQVVKKDLFWPKPAVDSAILQLIPHKKYANQNPEHFFKIVKAGFLHPRRQIQGNLSAGLKIPKADVEEILARSPVRGTQRAETLSVEDWVLLSQLFS